MPPTALLEEAQKTEQMFYAQCNACSNKQGNGSRQSGGQCETWAAADPLILRIAVAQETVQCAAL